MGNMEKTYVTDLSVIGGGKLVYEVTGLAGDALELRQVSPPSDEDKKHYIA